MEGYICINGNKTLLTPEQIKELGFCEKPVPVQGLALVRDSLRNGTFLKRFKLRDVIEDFGYHFEIIGCCHDRAEEDEERLTVTVMSKELLPAHRMHSGACPNGWVDTELRHWLNHDMLESLPDALRELIQPTIRESVDCKGRKHTSTDMLFLPTESELFGSAIFLPLSAGCATRSFPLLNPVCGLMRMGAQDGIGLLLLIAALPPASCLSAAAAARAATTHPTRFAPPSASKFPDI